MSSPSTTPGTRPAWLVLAGVLTLTAVVLLVPDLRSPVGVIACACSPLLVLAGVLRHRPQSLVWLMISLMLALWAAGTILVQVAGEVTTAAVVLVGAGQVVAGAVVLHVARAGLGRSTPAPGSRVDHVIIATLLGLVAAQLVAAGTTSSGTGSALVLPTVDVTILGLLLRYFVTSRNLRPSTFLALAAAVLTTVYDLASALQGQRIALPGEPAQVLGTLSILLFGVAALHPSMTVTFAPETFARRRQPSTSLLGLLPLVVVPVGLWWVAEVTGAPGLPTWALLVAASVVAGLCLLRAAEALRASEHMAQHDPLTDLANRRGLERAFADLAPRRGSSMLLIDVDEFKQVNDTHGHDTGDALLLHVRDRLLQAAAGAEVVARLGGDEFVVLTSADRAHDTAGAVLHALRQPVAVGDLVLQVSASIGVADTEPGGALAELLTRADVAMYAAKAAGRDAVVEFQPRMRVEVARRFALTGDVRQLLGGQSPTAGRLEVHYQPLVELASGEVIGAEALVRWRHPEHGLLAPDAFLGVVSSSGLDVQLDAAVLHAVLAQLSCWRDQGRRDLPVSINLTRDSLVDPRLTERVVRALAEAGVPASQLLLEITEHQELPDDSPAAQSLRDLLLAGVRTHLDDYGTGYTSLDYLGRFPVEVLKLDRSVVTAMTDGHVQLVAGVAAMAAALQLDVLAEGVETAEQRAELVRLGIRYGQGYLFSRPLPARDYADRLLGPARRHGVRDSEVPGARLAEPTALSGT